MAQIRALLSNQEQATLRSSHHKSTSAVPRGWSEYYLHGGKLGLQFSSSTTQCLYSMCWTLSSIFAKVILYIM